MLRDRPVAHCLPLGIFKRDFNLIPLIAVGALQPMKPICRKAVKDCISQCTGAYLTEYRLYFGACCLNAVVAVAGVVVDATQPATPSH